MAMLDGNELALRPDLLEKVTLIAVYITYIEVAVMEHGQILRSPIPHALITQIDTSSTLAVPGVTGVLTGEDPPEVVAQAGPWVHRQPPTPRTRWSAGAWPGVRYRIGNAAYPQMLRQRAFPSLILRPLKYTVDQFSRVGSLKTAPPQ